MSRKLRIAYFAHSLRSDWNNGNAHFLRGLLWEMGALGHETVVFEPEMGWSLTNLLQEEEGEAALAQFVAAYPDLRIEPYANASIAYPELWRERLAGFQVVVLHEWNAPELSHTLLSLRRQLGYCMVFHDTHHRAFSSPEQICELGIEQFDGVLAFGEVLRNVYRERFGITRVWTLHEAADVRLFRPLNGTPKKQDVVWVGNWGDEERSQELQEFLLRPAAVMREQRFTIYGVRYPEQALSALADARVLYGGYLPNLKAPAVYAESRLTVHVPRQQYAREMVGIPTIRVFEALASGIPLISAPWHDTEALFRREDLVFVENCKTMHDAIKRLLKDPVEADEQAARGRETILARHTCAHRAAELTNICEEVLR